ncbi:GlxA family transcriptional regulator [Curvivirga sp.]|uniref:GlxA family transcriptional regulator n=1 Tax=Curvivirga sp. TaxID=2856848 RepID=UPI003B59DA4E
MKSYNIAILKYPSVLKSAVFGLQEMFLLTNEIAKNLDVQVHISTETFAHDNLPKSADRHTAVIVPPSLGDTYHSHEDKAVTAWLQNCKQQGALLSSACAGSFLLGHAGVLRHRPATTHWALAEKFTETFPDTNLDIDKILINDGDILTAGGLMSWQDLGLELVSQLTSPQVMRVLGKWLLIDTGQREQRYYDSFRPQRNHGDEVILAVQDYLQQEYHKAIQINQLYDQYAIGSRTFLRRFTKATGLKPNEYLQRLRIQKACDSLESSPTTVETIAHKVGYEDVNAFRKTFIKITGLTPKEFRNRFSKKLETEND